MQQQEEVDAGDEPHVEQEEKEDTTAADAADAAAAPAAAATPPRHGFCGAAPAFSAAAPAIVPAEGRAAEQERFLRMTLQKMQQQQTQRPKVVEALWKTRRMSPPVEPRPPPVEIRAQPESPSPSRGGRRRWSLGRRRRHEGGAGHAQAEPADQEGEGGGLHGGEALAEARGQERGLPESF
ncbi:unnamed protein product [Ectocarpus sp. CCAP 1310/34]|nr:unnamed protein product [Ectocarpus sp. CCAP 1310/34]